MKTLQILTVLAAMPALATPAALAAGAPLAEMAVATTSAPVAGEAAADAKSAGAGGSTTGGSAAAQKASSKGKAKEKDAITLSKLRNQVIAAYNKQDYVKAARDGARYLERAEAEGRTGREVAAISFILGHSRYEVQRMSAEEYPGDYRAEVVQPLEESLRILQDDPAFKNMLLGNAYHELWLKSGRSDAEDEGRAHWYLLKSILHRETDVHGLDKDSDEYDRFARHLLFYMERCLDLAQDSASADLYLHRIRSMARGGFGTAYDGRFWQVYDLTYFDGGNMQAAALWQHGLDTMRDPQADPNEVLAIFQRSADLTRHNRYRAETYRQMADFVTTLDQPERRVQAAEFARTAFELNPADADIRRQYGSALHILSYGAYTSGRFEEALGRAEEAVRFEWDGMEAAFFDVSRAAAELGQETKALTHGERAYRMARAKVSGSTLQPFAQNYVNILRQFGQEGLVERILRETADLGVQ